MNCVESGIRCERPFAVAKTGALSRPASNKVREHSRAMAPLIRTSSSSRPIAGTPAYRSAPHNIEAEQSLLGAILVNNDAFYRVSDFLEPKHFFEPIHQTIYETAGSLIRMGKVATPVTLKTFLPADTDIGGMTVGQYLARLAAEATTDHQRAGLRPHHLRPGAAPRPDPDRRGHGQRRLRRAGGFRAARADRGCRAPALRTRRIRPLRRRLPALLAGADHRRRHGGQGLPARRQDCRASPPACATSTPRWAACSRPT